MGSLVLYMSMSLDGFIAGPGDSKDNPFGTKGHRLHKWLGDGGEGVGGEGVGGEGVGGFRPGDEPSQVVFDEVMSTGAVITGRRTGDFVGYWGGDHHDGVPIFVPTHRAPASRLPGDVRFVIEGIESCVEQAKAVTRPVGLGVEFLGVDPTGWQGEARIGFPACGAITRRDFGITFGLAADSKIVVGDKVDITLDVQTVLDA